MNARAWLFLLCAGVAGAQPLPSANDASLEQRLGAAVPLSTAVRGERGEAAHLSDYFAARTPVLLVLGYYRCPQLCGLVMHGLLDALHGTGLPAGTARIVGVSIDPADRPEDARNRQEQDLAYARWLSPAEPPQLDLLVAEPEDVQGIARTVGFRYAPREAGTDHPATVVVLTPEGKVARYFNGVGVEANTLRDALLQAREGRTGTWTDSLALLCSPFDPAAGGRTGLVLAALRALAIATLGLLAAFAWRLARQRGRR